MSVVSVKEQWAGRDAEFTDDWNRRYKRVFQVLTDDSADGPITVAFATGIPRIWDFFTSPLYGEYDILAVCRSVFPEQDEKTTAGSWNTVAAQNNRVEFHVLPAS